MVLHLVCFMLMQMQIRNCIFFLPLECFKRLRYWVNPLSMFRSRWMKWLPFLSFVASFLFSGIVEVLMCRLKARNALGHVFVSQVNTHTHWHWHTHTHTHCLYDGPMYADDGACVHFGPWIISPCGYLQESGAGCFLRRYRLFLQVPHNLF